MLVARSTDCAVCTRDIIPYICALQSSNIQLGIAFFTAEEEHLKDVRQEVNLLAPQWDIFGGHLSLKKSTIEIIRQNFPLSVERQLTEVVTDWLRWNYDYEKLGKPSWKILVKAVHLMNSKLADSIAQKHQGI